jgi:sulfopyruvate decarboxylase TPP-binding subunit
MFASLAIARVLAELGITHVVTVPDSTIGRWDEAIAREGIRLLRVSREGEAWAAAGGLFLGGATPLVLIQCTGLFESGDALRNIVHDWRLPIFAVIGYRSYLDQETLPGDTCLTFTEPILDAWALDWKLFREPAQLEEMRAHALACRAAGKPGVALVAEGKA